MNRAAYRVSTLHTVHAVRANLPKEWRKDSNLITVRFPHNKNRVGDPDTPYKYIHQILKNNMYEKFHATHGETRPGDHLIDTHLKQIKYELEAPPKGKRAEEKKSLQEWITNTFNPTLEARLKQPLTTILFTDGSQIGQKDKTKCSSPENIKSGAAFKLSRTDLNGTALRSDYRSLPCGKAMAFNTKMMALQLGISNVTKVEDGFPQKHIFIYADNKAALKCILDPGIGPSQGCTVQSCKKI